jgi:hypothetical protein
VGWLNSAQYASGLSSEDGSLQSQLSSKQQGFDRYSFKDEKNGYRLANYLAEDFS